MSYNSMTDEDVQQGLDTFFRTPRHELEYDKMGFTVEDWATIVALVRNEFWKHGKGYAKTGYGQYISQVLKPRCEVHYAQLLKRQRARLRVKGVRLSDQGNDNNT